MNKKKLYISLLLIVAANCFPGILRGNQKQLPEHIAFNINAEKVPFSSDSIKLTWQMNRNFSGDFVVGRSETPLNTIDDVLKSKLVGIFNPVLEGVLIDKNLEQGKDYYYIVIAREKLLKREIKILSNVNTTSYPVSLHHEPGMIRSLKAETRNKSIRLKWATDKAKGLLFNLYRSPSVINSMQELTAASKITSTSDNTFTDSTVPEFGTYYYAVTVTDKNNIEYFTPIPGENYTTQGAYIKEKTISTPLNVTAFAGTAGSIIIKWVKSSSRADKEISGYEIYRSDEIINSQFSLTKSRLIYIADKDITFYNDTPPGAGQFFYAVFSRYADGTVDVNFDTSDAYTEAPVEINLAYSITGIKAEKIRDNLLITWEFSGNKGDKIVKIFRTTRIPGPGDNPEKFIIGSADINRRIYTVEGPHDNDYYYGIFLNRNTNFITGINITAGIPASHDEKFISDSSDKAGSNGEENNDDSRTSGISSRLDRIIKNYFYKGRFDLASKELNIFIKKTDNNSEKALAKLFLGKAYIEMKEYERAILLLNSRDVKSSFPEESRFWSEFATIRLK
jgi:fibronectin type 3 domain-containing protein